MNQTHAEQVPAVAILTAAVAAFAVAAIVVWIARRLIKRSIAALDVVSPENRQALQRRARQVIGALEVLAFGIAAVASIALALTGTGIEVPEWTPRQMLRWAMSHGVHTLIIIAAAYITIRAAHLAIEHLEYKALGRATGEPMEERRRRAATLGGIVSSMATSVVFFGAGLMVLRELSIDVLPLLTGAGIAGLAVGFGAQNLVRDVISGFFMILEDQVRVGDVAKIQNVTGLVEQINLRTIVLRDDDGAVHVFPNGTITTLANLSKDVSYAVVTVSRCRPPSAWIGCWRRSARLAAACRPTRPRRRSSPARWKSSGSSRSVTRPSTSARASRRSRSSSGPWPPSCAAGSRSASRPGASARSCSRRGQGTGDGEQEPRARR